MTKIAIVTGSSRGLGRNTALNIARQGIDVVVTYHSQADTAQAVVADIQAQGRKAVALQLDAGDASTFPAFVQRLRQALNETWQRDSFDHLINNAGHGDMASIADTTEAQFDALVNVHFKGVFFLTQALLPLMADGGRIVNISSGLTRVSYPGFSAYSAVKGAVEVLSLYMAKELGSRGIAVNTVAPGAIETPMLRAHTTERQQGMAAATPLKRLGQPEEIAGAVVYLASADAGFITGSVMHINGGIRMD